METCGGIISDWNIVVEGIMGNVGEATTRVNYRSMNKFTLRSLCVPTRILLLLQPWYFLVVQSSSSSSPPR